MAGPDPVGGPSGSQAPSVNADEAKGLVGDQALLVEVGRLELHCARLLHTRSRSHRPSYLGFLLTFGDRRCPLLSAVHPSTADPARTIGVAPGLLQRSGPPRPGTGSANRHGRSRSEPAGGYVVCRRPSKLGGVVLSGRRHEALELLDDEARRVLKVVALAERTGAPLTLKEFQPFAEWPTRRWTVRTLSPGSEGCYSKAQLRRSSKREDRSRFRLQRAIPLLAMKQLEP